MNKLAMGLVIAGLSTVFTIGCAMEKKQDVETSDAAQQEAPTAAAAAPAPAKAQQPAEAVEVEEVQAEVVEE